MKKIADSHVHIRFFRDDDVQKMLDTIAEAGVVATCILPLPYRGAAENLAALHWKMIYDKMDIFAFGGLHSTDRYAVIPPEIQAKALLDLGCDGFKIMSCPTHRKFFGHGFNDLRYDKMFDLFEKEGTPLTVHVGDPEEFWRYNGKYYDKGLPSKAQLYDEIFEVLERHPNLKISFAHFFFLSNCPFEAVRVMEQYPNVYFDLTPGVEMYYNFDNNLEFWRDFFVKYSDRLLFGTDCNSYKSTTVNQDLETLVYRKLTESTDYFTQRCYGFDFTVRGLDLPSDVVEKICYTNFYQFVGKKKPVDRKKFYDYCERIAKDIETEPYDEYYEKGVEIVSHFKKDPNQQISLDFCKKRLSERKS